MSQDIKESLKESGIISRQALAWLRDRSLPADPYCYHIAYELIAHGDPDLKKRVKLLESGDFDLAEGIQQIYHDFVVSKQENNLKQFSKKIDRIANETLSSVSQTQDQLKHFSSTLEDIQPILQETGGDATMNVITLLIHETKNVHEYADSLEDKLKIAVKEIQNLQQEYLLFRDKANKDPLTQVYNRAGMEEAFDEASKIDDSYPMSVIMADIDHFKSFNDTHGHLIGDNVLKIVAKTLKNNIKRVDILARFGGEEFLMILPNTSKMNAHKLAETLRKIIANLAIKKRNSDDYLDKITLSIGVSELQKGQTLNDAIDGADRALYRAKNNGRNCVISE